MLKKETIKQFEGFGNDSKVALEEYHRSSGFRKSRFGISSSGLLTSLMLFADVTDSGSSGDPRSLSYGRSKAFSSFSKGSYLLASNSLGGIIQSLNGSSAPEYIHRLMVNAITINSHLVVDPKGRILYMQDQFLGMFNAESGTDNYNTGTITATNGSASVVGSGTTFSAGMVGKVIRITGENKFYKISARADNTHITLDTTYTGTTGASKTFVVNTEWNDSWKDFGAVTTGTKAPIDVYEDTVLFGRGNVITTLNTVTDTITTDGSPAFDLPSGFSIDHIVSNSNGILIGANVGGRGAIILWDNFSDRSIAPWIWLEDEITSICKVDAEWIVTTGRAIIRTNGYTTLTLATEFLDTTVSALNSNNPKNSLVVDNVLYFGGISSTSAFKRSVMYRFDLKTKLCTAFARENLDQQSPTFVQFLYVNRFFRIYSLIGSIGALNGVDYFNFDASQTVATYVTNPIGQGEDTKVATRAKVRIRKSTKGVSGHTAFTIKVALRINDMKNGLYFYSQVKANSTEKNKVTVDNSSGGYFTPPVGYCVEFCGDDSTTTLNNLGYSRNVISVTGAGTSSEVWTFDSDFPDLPQINQIMLITPFQLVKRKTITVTNGEISEILFDIKNSIKSHKFMLMVEIEANSSKIPIEIFPIDFIYDDQGVM